MDLPAMIELIKIIGYPALLFYILLHLIRVTRETGSSIFDTIERINTANIQQSERNIQVLNQINTSLITLAHDVNNNRYCPFVREYTGENSIIKTMEKR